MSGPHFEKWPDDEPLPVIFVKTCAKDYDEQPQITSLPVHHIINSLRDSGASDSQIGRALGTDARNIKELLKRRTISVFAADKLACAWGVHPAELWGSEWGSDISDEMEVLDNGRG